MDARVPVVCDCQRLPPNTETCAQCEGQGFVWVCPQARREDAPYWLPRVIQEPNRVDPFTVPEEPWVSGASS